jgi:hypothetical protein
MTESEMIEPGLVRISPELVDTLRRSADDMRHQMVENACTLAVERTGVADPRVTEALDAIRQRIFSDSSLRRQIDALRQELDEIAWDTQDRVEAGGSTESEYLHNFAKARAVAAIGSALEGSLASSFDSLYEAYYAIDDRDGFMCAVAG